MTKGKSVVYLIIQTFFNLADMNSGLHKSVGAI